MDDSGHELCLEEPEQRLETTGIAKPVVIEDGVWIGAHCIILPGVRIGHGSVIAAGSVVVKNIPAGCLAAGNPAKVIRTKTNG